MTLFREKTLLIQEVWFDEEPEKVAGVDICHYYQRTHPVEGLQFRKSYTMLVDLTKNKDELWKNLGKNNRYKIKRAAEKDEVTYYSWSRDKIDSNILSDFFKFHDLFTSSQGLPKVRRPRIRSFADAGILDLSLVTSQEGDPLVWHAHCCVKNRACMFYSASIKNKEDTTYQSILGRANRYHHWHDFLRFKDSDMMAYDFGGWYSGNTDQAKLGINRFKSEFGGEVIQSFKCIHGLTLKGKLCVGLYKMISK